MVIDEKMRTILIEARKRIDKQLEENYIFDDDGTSIFPIELSKDLINRVFIKKGNLRFYEFVQLAIRNQLDRK